MANTFYPWNFGKQNFLQIDDILFALLLTVMRLFVNKSIIDGWRALDLEEKLFHGFSWLKFIMAN